MREYREPSLKEILADPIVRALMEADGVDPEGVAALLRSLAGSHGNEALCGADGAHAIARLKEHKMSVGCAKPKWASTRLSTARAYSGRADVRANVGGAA